MKKIFSLFAAALMAVGMNAGVLIDYNGTATLPAGVTISGTTAMKNVKINTNTTGVDCIQLANGYNASGVYNGNAIILHTEDGFKAGDTLKVAGFFNNSDDTKVAKAEIFTLDADNNCTAVWTSEQFINGRTVAADPAFEAYVLAADMDSIMIGRNGGTGANIWKLQVVRPEAGPTPSENLIDFTTVTFEAWFGNPDWSVETNSTAAYDSAAAKATVNIGQDKNAQWNAQIKFHTAGIVLDAAKNYQFSFKMLANHNVGGVTSKIFDNAELAYKNDHALVADTEYAYTSPAFAGGGVGNGVIVFDLGYAKTGDVVEIYDLELKETQEIVIPDPEPEVAAPVPAHDAADVLAIYSDAYTVNPSWGYLEGWGQSTQLEEKAIEGNHFLYYKKFNYIGWGCSATVDASDYDSLHIDVWAAEAGNVHFFPIYGGVGLTTDDSHFIDLVLEEGWNSLDFELASVAGQDWSSIFQFKFAEGTMSIFAVDNVYFYGVSDPSVLKPSQVRAVYSDVFGADCGFGEWNSGTVYEQVEGAKKYTTAAGGYFGLEMASGLNCSQMDSLHIEILPVADMSLRIVPIHGGAEQGVTVNVTAGDWNVLNIALTEGDWAQVTDWSNVFQIKIDQAPNAEFQLREVYFFTTRKIGPDEDPMEDEPEGENKFVAANAAIDHTYFAYTGNWTKDEESTAVYEEGKITVTNAHTHEADWQAQVFLNLGFGFVAGNTYSFSFMVKANQDVNGNTFKVSNNDNMVFHSGKYSVKADKEKRIVVRDVVCPAEFTNQFIFDFGHAAEGSVIEIYDIKVVGEVQTGVESLNAVVTATKVVENGQVVIIRDGVRYNMVGAVVK